ncbi:ciliary microtubule inner protein 2A [Melanerpes formicivorus]|uniref:ciliary microtubule inner protein 2A n=1 Tax=Melanerpes formicivorus TaxID=211600 RepID=UPI00358F74C3
MAAPKENSLFPLQPYYLPGYEGFVPQYKFQCGDTYGRTTYRLLTDPGLRRSPRPLLAPLHKERFIEDFSGTEHGLQGYLPGRPGYFPYEKSGAAASIPEQILGPKPLQPWPGLAEEELVLRHMDPVPQHHPGQYMPRTPKPQRISQPPDPEGAELQLPELTSAWAQGRRGGPGQLDGALAGCRLPVGVEGGPLPRLAGAVDVEQDLCSPTLDIPSVILQKVIPGYTGFIPRFCWVLGVNYIQAVKEAMREFDQLQLSQKNPACSFGKRFPHTYWPENRIYTSAGLIPFYTGFVPKLRDIHALTFGDSTRAAYHTQ